MVPMVIEYIHVTQPFMLLSSFRWDTSACGLFCQSFLIQEIHPKLNLTNRTKVDPSTTPNFIIKVTDFR
jgi:hypothetical protein